MTPSEDFLEVGDTRVQLRRGGRGPALVVLHGLGDRGWFPFHDLLARRFTVLAPVHPGFGASDDPAWLEGVDDLGLFYLDFLDALRLRRVHLLGSSLGGWIAAELAVHHQERLASLVLVGAAGLRAPDADIADIFLMDPTARAKALYDNPRVLADVLATPPTPEMLQVELRERATLTKLAWDPYFHDPKLARRLERLRIPTLVLWGRHDRLVPRAVGEAYRRAIPGARLTAVDAGHAALRDAPGACARAVTAFLRRVAPRRGGRR
jgi:pimeloyl-ACP methyl ester carboxylesterase